MFALTITFVITLGGCFLGLVAYLNFINEALWDQIESQRRQSVQTQVAVEKLHELVRSEIER